jgi:hypothetical protein
MKLFIRSNWPKSSKTWKTIGKNKGKNQKKKHSCHVMSAGQDSSSSLGQGFFQQEAVFPVLVLQLLFRLC